MKCKTPINTVLCVKILIHMHRNLCSLQLDIDMMIVSVLTPKEYVTVSVVATFLVYKCQPSLAHVTIITNLEHSRLGQIPTILVTHTDLTIVALAASQGLTEVT